MQIGNGNMDNSGDFDLIQYTKEKINTAWQESLDRDILRVFDIIDYTSAKKYKKEKFVIIYSNENLKFISVPKNKKIYTCSECPFLSSWMDGTEIQYGCQNFCFLDINKINPHEEIHELCTFRMGKKCK